MDRAAIYISVSHVAATTQKTAGHGKSNTKINESPSSYHEVCATPSMNKKGDHLIYCDRSR